MTARGVAHTTEPLALARLPSGRSVETQIHRYQGDTDGPTVYLQALQHGGEVNGAAVLRRLHDRLLDGALSGEVIAVPVANPLAFDHRVYMAPTRLDAINSNMNRLWPGDSEGTLMERMVARLWSVIEGADAVVDLHTGGPYMLSHTRFTPGDERSRRYAAVFGLDPLVADGTNPENAEDAAPGKLREVAVANGIPSITPELSHSREIVEESVRRGVEGVANVLAAMDVLPQDPPANDPRVGTDKSAVYTDSSGLFRSPDISVGDRVRAGTELGEVFDPVTYETRAVIEATEDGHLLSLNRGSTVMEGESVGTIVDLS